MTGNGIAIIIIVSALLFGAVEVWSSALVLMMVYTLGLVWALRQGYAENRITSANRVLLGTVAVFMAYALLQIVPLPSMLVKIIAPSVSGSREFYSFSPQSFMPISLNPYGTGKELLNIAAFFIIYAVALLHFRDREELVRVITLLVVFGFVLALFGIIQKATWNNRIYWFRELTLGGTPFGPFVNRNHFAGFIGMLIPFGLALTFIRRSREKKILFGFLTVIMAVSLAFSLSRGGIISFVTGIGVFSFLMLQSRFQQKRIWAVGVFLTVLVAYLIYLGIDPVIERFYHTDMTKEQRLDVWSASLRAWKDFFFTGSGLGTFVYVFPLYSPFAMQSLYDHAHNDYIELMLETGVVGSFLLFLFAFLSVASLIRGSFEGRAGILRIGAFASAVTMAMHSIFDFNLHILSNLLLFALVLGINGALSEITAEKTVMSEE